MDENDRLALNIARSVLDDDAGQTGELIARHCQGNEALEERVRRLLRNLEHVADDGTAPAGAGRHEDDSADRLTGSLLGAFRVLERIGRGGMGVVYRGQREDTDFQQEVALKLIRRGFDFDDVHARFLRERRILARLDHPHLARFIDGGVTDDGRPWFALEFVRGQRITPWCDQQRLGLPQRVRLFLDVCVAVQYAHSQLVVHRDLKPDNILVDEHGSVRLLDFGIAGLLGDDEHGSTLTGNGHGYAMTPEYAAPEQFTGTATGVAADIYALGAVLYTLIAGVPPIALKRGDPLLAGQTVRDTPPQALSAAIHRAGKPDAAGSTANQRLASRSTNAAAFQRTVRGDLSRILDKALAKEPERRYASVDAFADDLHAWLNGAPVQATGSSLRYRLGKFVRRNVVAVTVASALACGLVATSILAIRMAYSERQQRQMAQAELERASAVRDYVMLMLRSASESGDGGSMTGREALLRGAEMVKAQFQQTPETGASTMLMLGELFQMLGDAEGAAPVLQQVVDWPEARSQPETLARARYQLAMVEFQRSRQDHARELLALAQGHWQGKSGMAAALLNESRVLQSQLLRTEKRFAEAVTVLGEAIVERRDRLQLIDRELGAALASKSTAAVEVGDYPLAMESAQQAWDLFQSLGVERSVNGLAALNNRAVAATYLDRFDEAIEDFRQIAEIHAQLYGRNSQLASVELNLARLLASRGRHSEAMPLLEDALTIIQSERGSTSAVAVVAMAQMAESSVALGDGERARELAETAIAVAEEHHRGAAVIYPTALRARATVRAAAGDADGAHHDLDLAVVELTAIGPGGETHLRRLEQLREKILGSREGPAALKGDRDDD